MSQTTHEAAEALRHAISTATIGELSFPTSLDASRRVLKAVENPDLGLTALAKIIVAEPLLSAKVIRLANSAALNPANKTIRDVRQAVLCVGMDLIKALAMVLIMDQLRQSQRHKGCRDLANRLWERNVHVAALSYVLAKKLTRLNADEVMFSAIVGDLGRFYLLSRVADFPALLEDPVVLATTINDLASHATSIVLDKLNLPASVVDAVLASRHYSGAMPPATPGDILFIAGVVSPRRDPFDELDTRVTPEAGGGAVAFGLDKSMVATLIAASGDEIYSIVVALES
ncbi:HDOD domain-containing protein [Propionivibrio sp.]|uniref:HDOD domain-containing protein n=1 Tax=Propionivibrio sp. TaxID=2212460 RepID=UPI0026245364|nr:HDOD domain-containing protein [Propionivibrio sp.]